MRDTPIQHWRLLCRTTADGHPFPSQAGKLGGHVVYTVDCRYVQYSTRLLASDATTPTWLLHLHSMSTDFRQLVATRSFFQYTQAPPTTGAADGSVTQGCTVQPAFYFPGSISSTLTASCRWEAVASPSNLALPKRRSIPLRLVPVQCCIVLPPPPSRGKQGWRLLTGAWLACSA